MIYIGRFVNLSNDKIKTLQLFCANDNIVKALIFNDRDFLSKTIPIDFDRNSLIYSQIFPYKFIPDTATTPTTYITMLSKYKADGNKYRKNSLYFYTITHKSLISTDQGLRYDFLIDKIDEIFNMSDDFNSSKLQFADMEEFNVDKDGDWIGSTILYNSLCI